MTALRVYRPLGTSMPGRSLGGRGLSEFESPNSSRSVEPCPNNNSMLVYSGSKCIGCAGIAQLGKPTVPEEKAAIVKRGWQNIRADDSVAIINAVSARVHGSWVIDGLK